MSRGAALAGPLAVLAIPKCPLCLLPLLAAAGISLPSAPLLDAIAIAIVALWAVIVTLVARSLPVRAAALVAMVLIVAGRIASLMILSWLGVAIMISIAAVRLFARQRICKHVCERGTRDTHPRSAE